MKTLAKSTYSAWNALRDSDKRWLFAAASLLALWGAGEILLHQSNDESAVLFAKLTPPQERSVLRHLEINAIPYRQQESDILVRKDMVHSLRAQIVAQEASAKIRPRAAAVRPVCKFGGR